jgi:leucyl aminopeptidase
MNFELKPLSVSAAASQKCDALLVLLPATLPSAADPFSVWLQSLQKSGDLPVKPGTILSVFKPAHANTSRLVLASTGDGSARQVRQAIAAALGTVRSVDPQRIVVAFVGDAGTAGLRAVVAAIADACYTYTLTKPKAEPHPLQKVLVTAPDAALLKPVFSRAVAISKGVTLAREWGNRPANHATPRLLGKAALDLSQYERITCEVLGPKDVAKLGMGAFMAVAQGSDEPLQLIVLRYHGAPKAEAPTVLVGKGITFDSGGISIKPAAEMDEMKFDMCGAASVLGTFRALVDLAPAINVVGLIPSCENLLSGSAVKPGDVVTSMSGQTIEILNTDAEGRLVLCDALTYAERLKPRAVIDIATLTGACVVALGGVRSGLFSADVDLAQALAAAGDAAQDLCWQLPLDDEYAEGLKTHFADMANVAGRAAGAVTAAKFLQSFSKAYPWAHLDIAGTAWKSGAAKGATGRPVGLLVEYLANLAPAPKSTAKGKAKQMGEGGKV